MNKKTLKILALALCLLILAGCGQSSAPLPPAEESPSTPAPEAESPASDIPQSNLGYSIGQTMPDFTFTDFEGNTRSLYETLQEKDAVLINLWATWCGPCGMEFPYMEESYQLHKDSIEFFALSVEPNDSAQIIADYAADMGLSFPMGQDSTNLAAAFMAYSIPTTVIIDRNAVICSVDVGAKSTTEAVTALYEKYIGDDYEGYVDPNAAPICDIAPADSSELNAALNIPGGELSFESFDSEYIWPMLPAEKDGRSVLVSSNQGIAGTGSAVKTIIKAKAGDMLAVNFALSSEEALDTMRLYVNGNLVKSFGGEKDWMSYVYPFPAEGEYEVSLSYEKNGSADEGEDSLWIDSVSVVRGREAEELLAANPVYPSAEANSLVPINPDAREIVFDDPYGALGLENSGDIMSFYIIPGDEARFRLELTPDIDPEALLFFSDYDGSVRSVISCAAEGGYDTAAGIDSLQLSGYPYSMLYLEDSSGASGFHRIITYFADEENLNAFVTGYLSSDAGQPLVSWRYADLASGDTEYTVTLADIKGNPVAGAVLQVCDDSACHVFTSDENGECRFALPSGDYEVHILSLPEGFEPDSSVYPLSPQNCELKLVFRH